MYSQYNAQSNILSTSGATLLPDFLPSPPLSSPVALDTPLKTIKHCPDITSLTDYRQAKALKLLDCGGAGTFKVFCASASGCQSSYNAPMHCGSRLCASCNLRSAKKLAAAWRYKLQDKPLSGFALLTLTLHISEKYTLAERYSLAYAAIRKLVRQQFFVKNVAGWVRKIEAKPAKKGGWNVHIHMLIEAKHERRIFRSAPSARRECDFFPADGSLKLSRQTVSDAWRELTGDSYRIDLIPVSADAGGANGAVNYLLKYMLKTEGFNADTIAGAAKILEYQKYMKGRRTTQAGGQFHVRHKQYSLRRLPQKEKGCAKCGSKLLSEFGLRRLLRETSFLRHVDHRYHHDYSDDYAFDRLLLVEMIYGIQADPDKLPEELTNVMKIYKSIEKKDL